MFDNCLSFNVNLSAFDIIGSLYRLSEAIHASNIFNYAAIFLIHMDFGCLPKTKMHKEISLSTLNTCQSTRKN
jgi:hypothetical protein